MTAAQATTVAENIALSPSVLAQRQHNQQTGDTQRVFQGRQRILNLTAVSAADGKPAMYLCNYVQGGFAIIAADRHMQPVLAFAERGALPTDELGNSKVVSSGLITWLENTKLIAAALRRNPSQKNIAAGAINGWRAMETPVCPDFGDGSTCDEQPTYTSTQVGPLVQSTWGQGVPYNAQCRFNGVLCQTGCVATSMAQVMRYWQYPARYKWTAMPYTVAPTTGYPELAELMHNVGDSVEMSYGTDASSAATYKIPDGFRSFGYSSADYHDYPNGSSGSNAVFYAHGNGTSSYFDVIGNLNRSWPVILGGYTDQNSYLGTKWGTGTGHNWVCDGYIQTYYNGTGYLVFSMNWGWNPTEYNGWFAFNDWAIYNQYGNLVCNYQYCQDVVINIHP